jgi:hypothetical protein
MNENIISIDKETRTVTIGITRNDGSYHEAMYDEFFHPGLVGLHWHTHETRHKSGRFYAATLINGKKWLLHRLILHGFLLPEFPEVDHIDPNRTLDCRVRNMRLAKRFVQMNNQRKHQLKPSGKQYAEPPALPWAANS